MRRKVREPEADLRVAGFGFKPARGKGGHGWWQHRTGVQVNLAGKSGADAQPYQQKQVREAIAEARRREAEEEQP